ncbi:riboflavin biosynthesis protein [Deltaproteobacteria bacterium]|nr:riboflavin biosynthesis protein [Deltaproteobacteria bacterium]
MLIASSLEALPSFSGAGVTIGNFDGVHIGHQTLVRRTLDICREDGLHCVLITFTPHPRSVLAPHRHVPLGSRARCMELLAELGVKTVLELSFTRELANMSPEEFARRWLVPLSVRRLAVGYDFSLGKNRGGSFVVLRSLGLDLGFLVEQLPPVILDGAVVSSTRLRDMIGSGDVRRAARLLGRFYGFSGEVTHGAGRGGGLGFSTANLTRPDVLLPACGVYAAFLWVGTQRFKAVTNVGRRPTFGGGDVIVESFLPDASENLYGQCVRLEFVARLRDERHFDSAQALKQQIDRDVDTARVLLESATLR